MAGLPGELREEIEGVDVHCVHGSPLALNDFLWESLDEDELRWRVEASGAGVLLCTHTGFPWQRLCGRTLVVNVGAVGRPANDGRTDTWYAVLELSAGRASAGLVPYDWSPQARSMRAAALPEPFVDRDRVVDHLPGDRPPTRARPGPLACGPDAPAVDEVAVHTAPAIELFADGEGDLGDRLAAATAVCSTPTPSRCW